LPDYTTGPDDVIDSKQSVDQEKDLENIEEEEYEDKYEEEDSEAYWDRFLDPATCYLRWPIVLLTSETVTELPLDSPSVNETGPRDRIDRMDVNVPENTSV